MTRTVSRTIRRAQGTPALGGMASEDGRLRAPPPALGDMVGKYGGAGGAHAQARGGAQGGTSLAAERCGVEGHWALAWDPAVATV